ncbi:MAG: hypothetical protein M3336_10670 [Chloroflexota bacterium]|nr:hypothetical protein [Chloroflexota bacterium]
MHSVLRIYQGATQLIDELAKREQEVRDLVTSVPGFISYHLIRTADGGVSITNCEDKAGTDESSRRAAEWIRQNLPGVTGGTPMILEGDVIFRFVDPTVARRLVESMQASA